MYKQAARFFSRHHDLVDKTGNRRPSKGRRKAQPGAPAPVQPAQSTTRVQRAPEPRPSARRFLDASEPQWIGKLSEAGRAFLRAWRTKLE